jgi:hypothetical protein
MTVLATCFVPVPVLIEANSRRGEHWARKKERKDERIEHTLAVLRSQPTARQVVIRFEAQQSLVVRLIAISPAHHEPNDDNLAGALKHYRDAVAHWLGIPDEDKRVRYIPKWEGYRGHGLRGVRIEFLRTIEHLEEEKAKIEAELATLTGKTG